MRWFCKLKTRVVSGVLHLLFGMRALTVVAVSQVKLRRGAGVLAVRVLAEIHTTDVM